MANVFAITAAVDRIALGASRRARTSFTVSNMAGRSLATRARAVPVRPDAGGWYTVAEPEREIMAGETRQFTVDIVVPRDTPAGEYTFRLDVAGIENPDEEFAQGPGVVVVVPEPELVPRRFPWWIVAAAGAALLIVVVVTALLLRDGDGESEVIFTAEPTVTPEPTITPVPIVLERGDVRLGTDQVFDLDGGELGDRSTADIELIPNGLRLLNDAQAIVFGSDAPGFDECQRTQLAPDPIPVAGMGIGNHLCVRTSEGNLAEIRIDNAIVFRSQPPRFGTVDMTFTTFEGG